jgi:hypothetical protein
MKVKQKSGITGQNQETRISVNTKENFFSDPTPKFQADKNF